MPIQVSSALLPKNGAKWHVVEDIYIKGGLRVVADAAARDLMYTDVALKLALKVGALVVTADNSKVWQYQGAGVWKELKKVDSFTFETEEALTEWNIAHKCGSKNFTYTVFDSDGFQVVPDECKIVDIDNFKLTFLQATAGHVTFTFNI